MAMLDRDAAAATGRVLRNLEDVEAHIRAICFKTGPPALVGAELEWTVHRAGGPEAPLSAEELRQALGRHAPAVLSPPHRHPAPHRSASQHPSGSPPHRASQAPPRSLHPPGELHDPGPLHPPGQAHRPGQPFAPGQPHPPGRPHAQADLHTPGSPRLPVPPNPLHPPAPAHSQHLPAHPQQLPGGGTVTVEPGGQLEISSAPATSTAALHAAVSADLEHLTGLLTDAGLRLGRHGIDPYRAPRRVLDTPRYAAMQRVLDAHGPHGRTMMCSTAGLQVCVDAGPAEQLAVRWQAALALGPPLVALFANSGRHAGRDTGLASARMAAWWGMDPRLSHPPAGPAGDPAAGWVRYALDAPVLCVRRDGTSWDPPAGLTLRDWVGGALPRPPTTSDLDYHLSLLVPPVRPRGYLEVRYLDCQPGGDWIVPVAVLTALLADPATTEAALELAAPVAARWRAAYRVGLADRPLHRAAEGLADLAGRRLSATGLPPPVRAHVVDTVDRRLRAARQAEEPR